MRHQKDPTCHRHHRPEPAQQAQDDWERQTRTGRSEREQPEPGPLHHERIIGVSFSLLSRVDAERPVMAWPTGGLESRTVTERLGRNPPFVPNCASMVPPPQVSSVLPDDECGRVGRRQLQTALVMGARAEC